MLRGVQVVVSGMALAGMLAAANVAQAQAAPAKPVLPLEGDAVVITMLIKPDKTADFESVLANKCKEALEEREARSEAAAGRHEGVQVHAAGPGQRRLHRVRRPGRQGRGDDISRVIAEVFPTEVQEIFTKYKDAFAGRAITALNKVLHGRAASGAAPASDVEAVALPVLLPAWTLVSLLVAQVPRPAAPFASTPPSRSTRPLPPSTSVGPLLVVRQGRQGGRLRSRDAGAADRVRRASRIRRVAPWRSGWRVFKAAEADAKGNAIYVHALLPRSRAPTIVPRCGSIN